MVSILLFNIFSFLIISGYTTPIHQIAEEMKKVQLKDWQPSIPYTGNDEISYLTEQFSVMARRIDTLVSEVIEGESRYYSQQLATLLLQINPHFLYNTLDVVNWMAREKNIPEIGDIVKALAEMMRYSLNYDSRFVSLSEEMEYVSKYLHIQTCRFGDKFEAEFHIPSELSSVEIPKLIVQPIVENCILHGFKFLSKKGKILISADIESDNLVITVEDNGIGMDEGKIVALLMDKNPPGGDSHHGIGVGNVNRRIQLLYGEHYGLQFKSSPGAGTICRIILHLGNKAIKETMHV